jgi:hypothetical protein
MKKNLIVVLLIFISQFTSIKAQNTCLTRYLRMPLKERTTDSIFCWVDTCKKVILNEYQYKTNSECDMKEYALSGDTMKVLAGRPNAFILLVEEVERKDNDSLSFDLHIEERPNPHAALSSTEIMGIIIANDTINYFGSGIMYKLQKVKYFYYTYPYLGTDEGEHLSAEYIVKNPNANHFKVKIKYYKDYPCFIYDYRFTISTSSSLISLYYLQNGSNLIRYSTAKDGTKKVIHYIKTP